MLCPLLLSLLVWLGRAAGEGRHKEGLPAAGNEEEEGGRHEGGQLPLAHHTDLLTGWNTDLPRWAGSVLANVGQRERFV